MENSWGNRSEEQDMGNIRTQAVFHGTIQGKEVNLGINPS